MSRWSYDEPDPDRYTLAPFDECDSCGLAFLVREQDPRPHEILCDRCQRILDMTRAVEAVLAAQVKVSA